MNQLIYNYVLVYEIINKMRKRIIFFYESPHVSTVILGWDEDVLSEEVIGIYSMSK